MFKEFRFIPIIWAPPVAVCENIAHPPNSSPVKSHLCLIFKNEMIHSHFIHGNWCQFISGSSIASFWNWEISYYNQATCRAFCLVSPSEKYQWFHTGLRNQFPEKIFVDVIFVISCRFDREKLSGHVQNGRLAWAVSFCLLQPPLLHSHH